MFQESELIALFIALCVIILGVIYNKHLKSVPHYKMLIMAFMLYSLSLICTVAEGFLLYTVLNTIEHISYLLSAIMLFIWYSMLITSERMNE